MTVLSGWGAEKTRDTPGDEKNRGKRKNRDATEDEGDDEEREDLHPHPGPPAQFTHPTMRPHSLSVSDASWPPRNGMQIPPDPLHHRFSESHLPPFKHSHPGTVQLTPTSELDVSGHHTFYQPVVIMAPPSIPTIINPAVNTTPGSIQNVTPTSLVHSSPAVETDGAGYSVIPLPDPPLSGSLTDEGDDKEERLGEEDGRSSIIRKQLVSARDARILVDQYVLPTTMYSLCADRCSFHSHLSPFLFGYQLQFGRFPYLPDGPKTMTPFILAVLCLVSSERLLQFSDMKDGFITEVLNMIESSPAESWLTFQTANAKTTTVVVTDGSGLGSGSGEDALDPELGIGPEEIVGASILATFWSGSPAQCRNLASCAFRWARGWINVSV